MSSTATDFIVIGAGINGVCISRELAQAGRSVTVLEAATVGSGTSSKSSRLIHGGLRYLESPGQWGLVMEALSCRQELSERYPDLVKMAPFYLPISADSPRPAWMIFLGLKLYDLFSRGRYPSRAVPKSRFRELFPSIESQPVRSIFSYYDGLTDDLALTRKIADEARQAGAVILENRPVTGIDLSSSPVMEVRTASGTYTAPCVVNATGPWIDELNSRMNLPCRFHIRKVSGIHILIDRSISSPLFLQARYPRIFFMIPHGATTIVGTTERAENIPMSEVRIHADDVAYLLREANRYLSVPIGQENIVDRWIGVRALVESNTSVSRMTREAEIDIHHPGEGLSLVHIFGGKLTTAVALGRKVAKAVLKRP